MPSRRFQWVRDAEEPLQPGARRPTRREKREASARGDELAARLEALPPPETEALPLSDEVREALEALRDVKSSAHGARRRARLRLSAMLRASDTDAIDAALGLGSEVHSTTERDRALAALQRWRQRMLDEGDPALDAFIERYPGLDRRSARPLVLQARADAAAGRGSRAAKKLFALLREAAELS